MTAEASNRSAELRRPKPDKMVTLACSSCRMALYMSERELEMATWRCPSCGAITNNRVARPATDTPRR